MRKSATVGKGHSRWRGGNSQCEGTQAEEAAWSQESSEAQVALGSKRENYRRRGRRGRGGKGVILGLVGCCNDLSFYSK